jgi:hypothetical protein
MGLNGLNRLNGKMDLDGLNGCKRLHGLMDLDGLGWVTMD